MRKFRSDHWLLPAPRRTSSGSRAQSRGSGQRAKNARAACRKEQFAGPRAVAEATYACSRLGASGTQALAVAGGIVGGAQMNGCQMDVGHRGIDVIVAHQRLEHGKVHSGFGQGSAEGMAECMRMAGWHTGASAVVAENST